MSVKIDDMTPRQRTYALKKLGVRIETAYPFNDDCDYWFVEFSDGETQHVRNQSCFKQFDGKAACEREAREIATRTKLLTMTSKEKEA